MNNNTTHNRVVLAACLLTAWFGIMAMILVA
jgi:hypothetical protein